MLLCNVCVCYVYILKMSKKIKVKNIKKTIDILERNKTIEGPSFDCHWKIMDS